MESVNETRELKKSDRNSQNIEFNKENWNCVTSQAFLKSYIQYLKAIDEKKNANGVETENKSTQDGKRRLTRSVASKAKTMELDCEHPSTGEHQLTPIIKTNDWHQKLCKCFKCLKIYEDFNIEFLFGIKNIEWLPTEILLTIVSSLLPPDRRVASECCNRFHDIWLCDDFIDDRRLVFDKCVLDPKREPLSIFLKSSRNYRHLVFGDVIMRGVSVFPAHFSKTVTQIELSEDFHHSSVSENFYFLSQFSNLKKIQVHNFDQLLENFPELPKTVELLEISQAGYDCTSTWNVERINKLKSNYLDKTSDSVRVKLDGSILPEYILTFTDSQRIKIQEVCLRLKDQSAFKLPRFNNLKVLELWFFEASGYHKDIVDDLQEQCPALKDLYIKVIDKLPHKDWSFLKSLWAFKITMTELPRFKIFENLQKLYIGPRQNCFFMHETVVNKNLKTLEIEYDKNPRCFTCFQTITKSFPELENLTYGFKITNNHLTALAKNTPKLKSLVLDSVDHSASFVCLPNLTALDLRWSPPVEPKMIKTFPFNLRKLVFTSLRRFDFKTVKLFEKLPALEELRLNCCGIESDNQVALFEMLAKSLKHLKVFHLDCRLNQENYPEIVEVMLKHCNYLHSIDFTPTFSSIFSDAKPQNPINEQILQKHLSLQSFNKVSLKMIEYAKQKN